MYHIVTNLTDVDVFIKSLNVDSHLSKWLSKVLKKEVVTRWDWLTPSSIEMSSDEHVQRAIGNGEDIFEISFCNEMESEIRHVVDWLFELERRDPRLFSKLDRITWKQSVEHSTRWHEALARAAEKLANEVIPFDDDCPVMFTHDDGYKWVWLKTNKARDDEGRVMGHCVGDGGYDQLSHGSGVFSLRDSSGRSHVTLELCADEIVQAMMKGNVDVAKKYSKYVIEFHEFMIPKLTLKPNKESVDHLVWWNGDEEWYKDGKRHRDGGPAVIDMNGDRLWYMNGLLHRENGPAFERFDGCRKWCLNGEIHRKDGPAITYANGDREWWFKNKRHREDGPAIEYEDGAFVWYINGEIHRDDGPAVVKANGDEQWWSHNRKHREDGPAYNYVNGDEEWYFEDKYHRCDGPAVSRIDGVKHWYHHGKRHRSDGPAIILSDGTQYWYFDGKRHREDGPAVIYPNGHKEWWFDDSKMSESKFHEFIGSIHVGREDFSS